jgi:hypothetical protein
MATPDEALSSLAAALAPYLLREVRAVLATEAAGEGERALAIAALAELGYAPGAGVSPIDPVFGVSPDSASGSRSRTKRKRKRTRNFQADIGAPSKIVLKVRTKCPYSPAAISQASK